MTRDAIQIQLFWGSAYWTMAKGAMRAHHMRRRGRPVRTYRKQPLKSSVKSATSAGSTDQTGRTRHAGLTPRQPTRSRTAPSRAACGTPADALGAAAT